MNHSLVLLLLLPLVKVVMSGCRWSNPTWLQSLESAPQVDITKDHLVTVGWGKRQFEDKFECANKFNVGVEHGGAERRLCSKEKTIGLYDYICKLDLSNPKHCDQKFSFWVSAVNLNHTRGVQIVNTFANSVLHIKCGAGAVSEISKVLSTSCLSVSPTWLAGPVIHQTEEQQIRFEWDRRQLTNAHCVDSFLLKLWESSSFSPKYTTLKISMTDVRDTFGGNVEVLPCKSYTYSLSAFTETGKAVDIQGELKIPCYGEDFMKPLREELDDTNDIGESDERSSAGRALNENASDKAIYPDLSLNVSSVKTTQNSAKMLHPLIVGDNDMDVKSSIGPRQHNMALTVILTLSFTITMNKYFY